MSQSATGPWEVVKTIPQEVYQIPASSPSHHVTYVTVVENEEDDWVQTSRASSRATGTTTRATRTDQGAMVSRRGAARAATSTPGGMETFIAIKMASGRSTATERPATRACDAKPVEPRQGCARSERSALQRLQRLEVERRDARQRGNLSVRWWSPRPAPLNLRSTAVSHPF
jgi:hypothetical protein